MLNNKQFDPTGIYEELGISAEVLQYSHRILEQLKERFDAIDQTAESNQMKVLAAFQKNRVSEACLQGTTGYVSSNIARFYGFYKFTIAIINHNN